MEFGIIPAACTKLNDTIEQLSTQIKSFASNVREARRDLDSISRELSSLSFCLETLREDASQLTFPDTLQRNLIVTVGHCEVDVARIDGLLRRTLPQNGNPRLQWSTTAREELERYRSDLEGHKRTIDIALDMSSMLLVQSRPHSSIDAAAEPVKQDEPTTAPALAPVHQNSMNNLASFPEPSLLPPNRSPRSQPRRPISMSNSGTSDACEADSFEITSQPASGNGKNRWSTSAASPTPQTHTSAPTCSGATRASSEKEVMASDEKELAFRRRISAPIRRKAVPDPVEKEVAISDGIQAVRRRPPGEVEWDSSTRLKFRQLPYDNPPEAVPLRPDDTAPPIPVSSLSPPSYQFSTPEPDPEVSSTHSRRSSKVHLTDMLNNSSSSRHPKRAANTPLYRAIETKNLDDVATLLRPPQSASPHARCGIYAHALEAACSTSTLPMVRLLLVHAIRPAEHDPHGLALQAACARGHEQMATLLLAHGADVNAVNAINSTTGPGNALQAAITHNKPHIARLLLSKGANPNQACGEYGNALHIAAFMLNAVMVKLLLDNGADVNARGLYGSVVAAVRANKAPAEKGKGRQREVLEVLKARGVRMSFFERMGSDG